MTLDSIRNSCDVLLFDSLFFDGAELSKHSTSGMNYSSSLSQFSFIVNSLLQMVKNEKLVEPEIFSFKFLILNLQMVRNEKLVHPEWVILLVKINHLLLTTNSAVNIILYSFNVPSLENPP